MHEVHEIQSFDSLATLEKAAALTRIAGLQRDTRNVIKALERDRDTLLKKGRKNEAAAKGNEILRMRRLLADLDKAEKLAVARG